MRDYSPKILIIEDNLDNLNILTEMLNEQAYKVKRAVNGTIALRSINQVSPDLILLDILLPDLSGYDLCQQLKANHHTCHIPIIFISALSDPHEKVKAFEMGGADYITKPFATAEVFARIQNQLQLKGAKAEIEALNSELEERVQARTTQLSKAKATLEQQFEELNWADQALKDSEARFRALIENTSDIVLLVNSEGIVHYISPSVHRNLRFFPTDFLQKPLKNWIHPVDQPQFVQMLKGSLASHGISMTMELRWKTLEDTWVVFEVIAQQFADNTGFSGVALNARDISERQKIEAIQQALQQEQKLSQMKLRFFSMTSHEFRTPLSVIQIATDLLENSISEGKTARNIRNIHRIQSTVQQLTDLLSNILDIARMEAQKLEIKPTLFHLNVFCEDLVEALEATHQGESRIQLMFQGQFGEVMLDEKLLHKVLSNLLTNALKYSKSEQIVDFQVTQKEEQVEFKIVDHGIGIPIDLHPHLFEPFQRGKNVGKIEGSGLGLAIVKKCVDSLNGQISFTSTGQEGTTFVVTLPTHITSVQAEKSINPPSEG